MIGVILMANKNQTSKIVLSEWKKVSIDGENDIEKSKKFISNAVVNDRKCKTRFQIWNAKSELCLQHERIDIGHSRSAEIDSIAFQLGSAQETPSNQPTNAYIHMI